MRRFDVFPMIVLPLAAMLASCSVIDTPLTAASGAGISRGSAIAFMEDGSEPSGLHNRVRAQLALELPRVGYPVSPDAQYMLEFSIAKRPTETGIYLPEGETARPEAGTWRSRPSDRDIISLCTASIHRLMLVISRTRTGEVVFRGSSDDDFCNDVSDEKLKKLVASAVARLRG